MTYLEVMKYIESEYSVINYTPCPVCGGGFEADDLFVKIIDDTAYDVCTCVCTDCGYEKEFEFRAPFLSNMKKKKNQLS